MNWDRIQADRKQFKGQAKQRWGKLTHDNLDILDGRREQLVGRIQEAYGISKDEADGQINDWQKSLIEQDAAAITTERAGAAVHETHALFARTGGAQRAGGRRPTPLDVIGSRCSGGALNTSATHIDPPICYPLLPAACAATCARRHP